MKLLTLGFKEGLKDSVTFESVVNTDCPLNELIFKIRKLAESVGLLAINNSVKRGERSMLEVLFIELVYTRNTPIMVVTGDEKGRCYGKTVTKRSDLWLR